MTEELETIGKYKIRGTLGRGAMGVVYRAEDPEIGREVAIKTLRKLEFESDAARETSIERFRNEARSAGRLRHPNIITIFEVNIEGDLPYIVMDWVEGETLDQILGREGRLPPAKAVPILHQVALGIDAAHAKGVIHRDLKPSNLIVDDQQQVYILDFGVAKLSDAVQGEEKKSDHILGTPAYMAPEQILNLQLGPHSDLFTFGIIAFEMLSGKRPYSGSNFHEIVQSILNEEPSPLTSLVPDLPLQAEFEIERALAKKPEHRFSSAIEFVNALEKSFGPETIDLRQKGAARERKPSEWRSLSGSTGQVEEDGVPLRERARADEGGSPPGGQTGKELIRLSPSQLPAEPSAAPGDIFSHSGESVQASVGLGQRVSPLQILLVIVGAASIAFAGILFYLLSSAKPAMDTPETMPIEPESVGIREDPSTVERFINIEAVRIDPGAAIAELPDGDLLGMIVHPETSERRALEGLKEAEERGIPEVVDAASITLQSDSYILRIESARVIGDYGDKRGIAPLLIALDDYDPLVRLEVARALQKLGNRASIGYLRKKYEGETDPQVRKALQEAIETIQGFPISE